MAIRRHPYLAGKLIVGRVYGGEEVVDETPALLTALHQVELAAGGIQCEHAAHRMATREAARDQDPAPDRNRDSALDRRRQGVRRRHVQLRNLCPRGGLGVPASPCAHRPSGWRENDPQRNHDAERDPACDEPAHTKLTPPTGNRLRTPMRQPPSTTLVCANAHAGPTLTSTPDSIVNPT